MPHKLAGLTMTVALVFGVTPRAGLPPYTFDGLPGWLGIATVSQWGDGSYWWSPASDSFHAAVFTDVFEERRSWESMAAGLRFTGVSASGVVPLVFSGFGLRRYGCDKSSQEMATFTGRPMAEGPVWLLPTGAGAVVPVPVTAGAAAGEASVGTWDRVPASTRDAARSAARSRIYGAGPVTLVQYLTGGLTVKTVVVADGRELVAYEDATYSMGDTRPEPIALSLGSRGDIGIPQAVGAFRFGTAWPMAIVFWLPAYEGNRFNVLRVDRSRARLFKGPYIYYCGY